MIDTLSIAGLRGFGVEQTISFSKPDHQNEGSGLTFIVGANNTGKTTIVEAIRAFNCDDYNSPSFSPDKRNVNYQGGMIRLVIETNDQSTNIIETVRKESGLTRAVRKGLDSNWRSLDNFVLSARRASDYEFNRNEFDKSNYLKLQGNNQTMRRQNLIEFGSRLFAMDKHRDTINPMLKSFFGDDLQWGIEVTNGGAYYLNITTHNMHHSSEGIGDGIWSIFTICDSLRDLSKDETVVIDEPELSLHPTFQRKLIKLLVEKSKDRQIIVCTHSPYFIDLCSLSNGASLYRTTKDNNGDIKIFSLSSESTDYFKSERKNLFNPHICGIEAKELFFLEDRVIVVEGQDDVVYYKKASQDMNIELAGTFYGWGAGGAGNIPKVLNMLSELGYTKVVAIFDGDKKKEKEQAEQTFRNQEYCILIISSDDVRDKFGRVISANGREEIKQIKSGLMDEHGVIKEEHKEEMRDLFLKINQYFDK